MMKEIVRFAGVVPRANAALLPDNAAQTAANCALWNNDLRPLKGPLDVVTPTALGGIIKSIYRIGQTLPENQYWMAWTTDVDVVRGMIAGDTSERTYFTGSGTPKVTNLALATQGGTTYPVVAYDLGIPKPAQAPTCTPSGAAAPVETRVYVYTYVSGWGEEGVPSAPTKVTVSQGGTVQLANMSTAPAGSYNITAKRIYRAQQTASGAAALLFVAEIPVAQTTYNDTIAAADLGDELSTADYDMPPATMAGMTVMPNGMAVAFDGYDILFCEPFKPYAWPGKYRLTADYPIVGLGVFGSTVVVMTTGNPYLITGTDPATMSMDKMSLPQACVSKRSIVNVDDGVMYASPDGLVYVGAGGARLVTESKYDREKWQALGPSTISAYWHDGRYIAFYTGGAFIFEPAAEGDLVFFDDAATAGYVDRINDALYLCSAGVIRKFNAGVDKTYTWRSKKFQYTGRTPPAFAMVDATGYPLTLKLFWDGALKHTQTVASERPFALPGGSRPREVEIELSGTAIVRYAGLADAFEEFRIG